MNIEYTVLYCSVAAQVEMEVQSAVGNEGLAEDLMRVCDCRFYSTQMLVVVLMGHGAVLCNLPVEDQGQF